MKVKIKQMHDDAILPKYAHPGDVGLDVYNREEDYTLQPGERKVFFVGFSLKFEPGYVARVCDRSSVPNHYGLHTMGGIYDAGYRGEYNVQLVNLSDKEVTIEKNQKIAQILIYPVIIAELEEVTELSDSDRGDGRFGSTGKF
ncbi:MAG: dUTP diphosphatase [Candidatus Magasanikbacteria bacterium]|jgi:dUTP pyrophosphatase|nr:dUTP diphosphatase [Candidatus Magasanikbacteria bacterium]MBT4071407.1 dUTP diphosphatase [Candidatus Magasanikbacteria bacterium]